MILAKVPLRITLGGGGTDLPAYADVHRGLCLTAAVNLYVYAVVQRPFRQGFFVKYSGHETADCAEAIQHDLIRECVLEVAPEEDRLEVASFADVPGGTGLGSSGAFTATLVAALRRYMGDDRRFDSAEIAESAFRVEAFRCQRPVGRQDHYACACGGVNLLSFGTDKTTEVIRLSPPGWFVRRLNESLVLVAVGEPRSSYRLLRRQSDEATGEKLYAMHRAKEAAYDTSRAIESGDWDMLCLQVNDQWKAKLSRCPEAVNRESMRLREIAMMDGRADACKHMGAGGGGFLLALTPDVPQLLRAMDGKARCLTVQLADTGLEVIRA